MEGSWLAHSLTSRGPSSYDELGDNKDRPSNAPDCHLCSHPAVCGLIDETSPYKQRFDVAVMLCIIYSAAVVPFRIAFRAEATGWVWVLEASISLLFVADLVVAFNTSFISTSGMRVTSRSAIANRYLRSWFLIDAPSSVPVEIIELIISASEGNTAVTPSYLPAFRLLRLLRLVRILRLLKLGSYVSRLEEQLDINLRPLKVGIMIAPPLHAAASSHSSLPWLRRLFTYSAERSSPAPLLPGGGARASDALLLPHARMRMVHHQLGGGWHWRRRCLGGGGLESFKRRVELD